MSRFPLCVVPLFLAATMWADDAGKQLDAADSLAAGCSEFACKLYGQIRTREGNLCLSPFSISTAGAMLTAGANGDTAKQLNDAFVFPAAREDLLKDWRRMRKRLGKSVSVGEVTLRLANAAWFEKSEPPIASYTGALDNAFRAHVFPTSFRTAPDAARSEINAWVARATRQRGMQLFGPDTITLMTAVVLVNAAYFQGSWRDEFDRYDTKRRTFHLAANRRIRVPTMRRQTTTRYAQHRMLKVVPLSYKSCSLEMILLVPEKVDGLADVEAALTGEKLAEWLQPGKAWRKSVEVKLYLPKFRIKSDFRLKVPLQALGVKDAFSNVSADLSEMFGEAVLALPDPPFVTASVHSAGIVVSEEGTEAWAGSGDAIDFGGEPPEPKKVTIRVNRPFLFLVRDRKTGLILFMGRVVNPRR